MKNKNDSKPEELVIMSWAGGWGQALQEAVSQPFTQLTGIRVRHEINVGLKLPNTLVNALQNEERPPFDVIWSNSVPAIKMAHWGVCDALDEETVPNLTALVRQTKQWLGKASCPIALPYLVYYVLVYRVEAFPQGGPDSWQVLLDPQFRNKIALYPGGNGFYPVAQVMGGGTVQDIPENMEPCWSFMRKLMPQIGKLDYSIGMGEQLRRGDLDLCFRALTNALAFQREGLNVNWVTPAEGVPDTADALWVPANLPENVAYWAKRYINFALSIDVQTSWCQRLGAMPLNQNAAVPNIFLKNPTLPHTPDNSHGVLHVSDTLKAQHEENWEMLFNEIFNQTNLDSHDSKPSKLRAQK